MGNIFNSDFRDFIHAINENKVDYILVGGFAVILHGHSRVTGDMDIWVKRTKENYHRLQKAFYQFKMPVFDMTIENFLYHKDWDVFKFGRKPVAIDIMTKVKGLDFDECFELSKIFETDGLSVRVLHVNSLINAKKASGRLKDLDDINQLTRDKFKSGITIRQTDINDSEFIADISRRTFYETFAQHNTKENMDKFMNEVFTEQKLIDEIGRIENIFYLAYLNDDPVGYVKLREGKNPIELGDADAIEIARIYADKKAIGKGIGKALMLKCFESAKEKNKELIWLGVWEHNPTAISFYKKFGFEQFGSHVFMLGDDVQTDLLMKRSL